jgi:hypothetical protein
MMDYLKFIARVLSHIPGSLASFSQLGRVFWTNAHYLPISFFVDIRHFRMIEFLRGQQHGFEIQRRATLCDHKKQFPIPQRLKESMLKLKAIENIKDIQI